jgi:hypothetical protein
MFHYLEVRYSSLGRFTGPRDRIMSISLYYNYIIAATLTSKGPLRWDNADAVTPDPLRMPNISLMARSSVTSVCTHLITSEWVVRFLWNLVWSPCHWRLLKIHTCQSTIMIISTCSVLRIVSSDDDDDDNYAQSFGMRTTTLTKPLHLISSFIILIFRNNWSNYCEISYGLHAVVSYSEFMFFSFL